LNDLPGRRRNQLRIEESSGNVFADLGFCHSDQDVEVAIHPKPSDQAGGIISVSTREPA
jgi:hypothetical protein